MRIYLAAALLLAFYLLPWLVNPAASLTPSGYDLAEWTSAHPSVQAQTPEFLTTLLLRLPLACIGLLVAFSAPRRPVSAVIVLVLAAALLPPEIIPFTGNGNSRQQGALAALVLLGGALGWSGILARYQGWIATAIALVGGVSSIIGLAQAYDLMRGFGLPTQIGAGGVGLAVAFLLAAGVLAVAEIRQRRRVTTRRIMIAVNQTG